MKDMTLKEYDAMVRRLEDYARTSPRAYKLRVAALAVFCYGYVIMVTGLVGALAVALCALALIRPFLFIKVGIYIGLPALALMWSVGKSLVVRLDPPEGERLTPAEAPELFAMIEEVRASLDASPIHAVVVTDDYNAAANQHPVFGMFGIYKNYLILGLPLMMSLSAEELRSVIGHELGHMAGDHSRFGNWIYRQRISLHRLRAQLGEQSSILFRPLFTRFIPYFNAYSFALARANEYEADASAAKVTDEATAARALARVHADGEWLDDVFWKGLRSRSAVEPEPPRELFLEMNDALAEGRDVAPQLGAALERKSTFSDTHPSLAERLEALGQPDLGSLDPPADHAAASLIEEARLRQLIKIFSVAWRQLNEEAWRYNHSRDAEIAERLEALGASGAPAVASVAAEGAGAPDGDEEPEREHGVAFERAMLVLERDGAEDARPLFERFVHRFPDDPEGQLILGQIRLLQQDATGEENLERALALDLHATGTACDTAIRFWMQHNEHDRAQLWIDRANEWGALLERAHQERNAFSKRDTYLPPEGIDEETLAGLIELFGIHAKVKRVWLVRKLVVEFPEEPLYVLGVQFKRTVGLAVGEDEALAALAQDVEFPHGLSLFNVSTSENKWIKKPLQKVEGSCIYEA